MEIKKIFEKIHNQEEEKEYFFALLIEEEKVKSALWTIEGEAVKVLRKGEDQFWQTEEEILPAVDACLPPIYEGEQEPVKTIFGIPSYWTKDGEAELSKIELLKKICRELDLTAIGFVVIPEAAVYHLKAIEGIPPTAILVGLGKKKITVTLVKLGKILGNEVVERSGNLGEDVVEGISRFLPQEVIPPRIILYGEEGETEKEELMSFSWNDFPQLNFLHLPKVEVLPSDFDISSVALAGGREVKKEEGITIAQLIKEEEKEQISEKKLVELEEEPFLESKTPPGEFGFVLEKDIAQEAPLPPGEAVVSQSEETPTPEEIPLRRKIKLPKINFSFKNFFSKISFSFLFPRGLKKAGFLAIIILIFLGGVFFLAYWYLPKAEVILWVKPQIAEKNFTLKLDPKISTLNQKELVLPAEEVKAVVAGQKKKTTTGTKLVGEPARGEVTVYNGVGVEKKFPVGTIITSSSGIKFTLEEDLLLASRSSAADPTPTKIVKVKAVNFGSEGNLVAGSEFTIANFSKSDYVAKNEEAFSGGTSREVQVVAEEDQKRLLEELTKELEDRSLEELQKNVSSGKRLIKESLISKVEEKSFDKKVGEEGDELSLNLKINFTALTFSEKDFQQLAEEEVKKAIPPGFEYKPEEAETKFTFKNVTKEGAAVFEAYFKTSLFPTLDLEAIKKNLAGKYPEIGKAYLGSFPGVDSYEAKIYPRLPGKLTTFPRLAKNIKIEVKRK